MPEVTGSDGAPGAPGVPGVTGTRGAATVPTGTEGPWPAMDVPGRVARLREAARDAGIDALLVTRLVNIRYLTGFTGSAATLFVPADADHPPTFVTDGRYRDQSADETAAAGVDLHVEVGLTPAAQRELVVAAAGASGVTGGRVGLEAAGVTWAQHRRFASEWFPDAELVPTDAVVEGLRRVKDPGEVARIRAACAIADDALAAVGPSLAAGPTEREFALALEFAMRGRGAAAMSFEPIVASGPNGARPHARPSDRRVGRDDLVVLDFGCVVDGYCSDMTRTVAVDDPGPDARRLYETVLAAQAAGRAAVGPGVAAADVDAACRDLIDEAGWGDAFVHGTGHGVGLEVHEEPRVTKGAGGTLVAGNVVTVEPGVYLPGVGGVRIEDTVVVTDDGSTPLTEFPKGLHL